MSFNKRTLIRIKKDCQIKEVAIINGKSLLEILQNAKVLINSSCGGQASCGTCKIEVTKSALLDLQMNELEKEYFESRPPQKYNRLACQIFPSEDISIVIPDQILPK